jgi:O-antigen ligase
MLEPGKGALSSYEDTAMAMRGRSLIGVSIMTGAFLNVAWPFAVFLTQRVGLKGLWRRASLVGVFIAPLGVFMSYSRGAIAALLAVIGGQMFFGLQNSRRSMMFAIAAAIGLISFVGVNSEYFFVSRLEQSMQVMLEDPLNNRSTTERVFAYTEPIADLAQEPMRLLVGRGLARQRFDESASLSGLANHAVFAQAYYTYGMLAALLYVLLVVVGFKVVVQRIMSKDRPDDGRVILSRILLISLLGLFPWFLLGHAAVSQPRGAMIFFLVFGLIASLSNFGPNCPPERVSRLRGQRRTRRNMNSCESA